MLKVFTCTSGAQQSPNVYAASSVLYFHLFSHSHTAQAQVQPGAARRRGRGGPQARRREGGEAASTGGGEKAGRMYERQVNSRQVEEGECCLPAQPTCLTHAHCCLSRYITITPPQHQPHHLTSPPPTTTTITLIINIIITTVILCTVDIVLVKGVEFPLFRQS